MTRILRASDFRRERWKNGLGWTREIARGRIAEDAPVAAEGDDWHWRLSVAEIDRDCPFSSFPGIRRVLVLIDGAGMHLIFADNNETVTLTPSSPRIDFEGARRLDCCLLDGPTRDFNLIWRPADCHCTLVCVPLHDIGTVGDARALRQVIFVRSGELAIDDHVAGGGDALLLERGDGRPRVRIDGNALVVSIGRAAG